MLEVPGEMAALVCKTGLKINHSFPGFWAGPWPGGAGFSALLHSSDVSEGFYWPHWARSGIFIPWCAGAVSYHSRFNDVRLVA